MSQPEVGSQAPDFTALCWRNGQTESIQLSALRGKTVILAFYPKDNTPGCTKEMCAFRDDYSSFVAQGIEVSGVSRDSIASHQKFAEKFTLGALPLISDADGKISEAHGVGGFLPKRTLFVIDIAGQIKHVQQGMPKNEALLKLAKL